MPFIQTDLKEVKIFEPVIFKDDRGYFYESYREDLFSEAGIKARFIQDNQSKSTFGVIRALHFQNPPYAQAKLVRVISGRVFDVAVDIRKGSPSFGKWVGFELSAENRKQLFIPRGFAHGFAVLSETAEFSYKCDNYYNRSSEGGINFSDPDLNITWGLKKSEIIISEKDKSLPFLG